MATISGPRAVWIIAAIGTLLAGACGGNSPAAGGTIDSAFLAKANAVCAAAFTRKPETPPPLPVENFDPQHPLPDQLPAIGAHFTKYNDSEQVHRELAALGEPRTGIEDWRTLLDLTQQSSDNTQAQIDAANAKDVTGFVRLVNEGIDLTRQMGQVAPRAGFAASTPCTKYYGG